ncbi:hypothetical protein CMV_028846 [Castanea mollissima]|uniref:Uncharacterized protein n=1 Tax=Castanea mollissima TaxID=60419 RepID=A0A8J4VDZ4_9ROSI|nr:hypothetical protein CMV_028846 [Castanea mollissima]
MRFRNSWKFPTTVKSLQLHGHRFRNSWKFPTLVSAASRRFDCTIEVISKDFRGSVKEKFLLIWLLEFQIGKNRKFWEF